MKINRCLCCGKILDDDDSFYHKRCAKKLFSSQQIPALNYTQEELNELAKNTILAKVSVPGVQPKLSLHLEREAKETTSPLPQVGLARNYILKPQSPQWKNLPLPIGISDYRLASTEYYYIDKTMLIKDFLDERPMVSLFTRPRRFGKTLNMDMLRTFFEKSDEDTSVYFQNKKIWTCGQKYRNYQGKYPVIFVSFKDVKCATWQDTYENIYKLLQKEFERHLKLLESPVLNEYDKLKIKNFLSGKADANDCMAAFATLSRNCTNYHY